ncbi:MAG: DMT family transporter [Nocardioides sp.]|uniref:DMT family transporter n=1 Tax=Nocardioides sp. TaxID=35761 RepID=UPI0039E6AA4A
MTWLAIAFALASAFSAGLSTSVQHHAAENAPRGGGVVGLLRHLAGRPWWLFGQALGLVTVVFHAAALHFGPLALVQPIVISGIVFAVPIRAAISRQLPPRAEVGWVALTAVGLAIFLVASDPSESTIAGRTTVQVAMTAATALVAYVLLAASKRIHDGQRRAFVLGIAAGLLFGLVAVTLKIAVHELAAGGVVGALTSWSTWALVVVGVSGVATNQFAYHSARLSASMPVLNIVDVLVALGFGYIVFEEVPRHTPWAIAAMLVAMVAVAIGLWQLAIFEEEHQEAELEASATTDGR